jgi:Brp/Blh family beta-carotene 15,15'-monooxygenase
MRGYTSRLGTAVGPGANVNTPLAVSRLALAVLAVLFGLVALAGITIPLSVQAGVYLVGMVAMNLPHGGFEHFDNLRRRASSFQATYIALYLGGIAAFTALFFLAPVAGLALALCVAMAKGGQGDLHVLDATTGTTHLDGRGQRALAAAVRGGAVMLVPIVFQPGVFTAFSTYMVNIFEPGALGAVAGYFELTRWVVAGGYGLLVVAHLGLGALRGAGTDSFRADAAETLLLIAYFAVVPVVIAVGLYFPFWYSARQVARTTAVDEPPESVDPDSAGEGLLGFLDSGDPQVVALGSWGVLVVGALATFGLAAGLWTVSPQPLGGAPLLLGLVAFWSVFISIVALPHVVVGSWFDTGRGIWYVP